jgi:hypothetical protein
MGRVKRLAGVVLIAALVVLLGGLGLPMLYGALIMMGWVGR